MQLFIASTKIASAPCRSVLLTAAALNIKLNLKKLDMMKKEHLTPEFLKINPRHTLPTLVDDDLVLWESKAICVYLFDKCAKNDSLYPKDPKTRAIINQRFYFDMGDVFKYFYEYYFAAMYGREQKPEDLTKLKESLLTLDSFLESTGFAAGTQQISLADLVLFATVSTIEVFDFDFTPYPRVEKWLALMKQTAPGIELNNEGIEQMKVIFKK